MPDIWETLEDMLTEAAPYSFADGDAAGAQYRTGASPVDLINEAWDRFLSGSGDYVEWEKKATADYISA